MGFLLDDRVLLGIKKSLNCDTELESIGMSLMTASHHPTGRADPSHLLSHVSGQLRL